jgi:hypothetical protein
LLKANVRFSLKWRHGAIELNKKPAEAGLEGLFRFSTVLLIRQATNLLPLKSALIDHKAGTDCAYQGKDDSKHEKN